MINHANYIRFNYFFRKISLSTNNFFANIIRATLNASMLAARRAFRLGIEPVSFSPVLREDAGTTIDF